MIDLGSGKGTAHSANGLYSLYISQLICEHFRAILCPFPISNLAFGLVCARSEPNTVDVGKGEISIFLKIYIYIYRLT